MIMLRSAVFNVVFFAVTFLFTIAATFARLVNPELVLKVAMQWARTEVAAARIICGITVDVRGLEHIPHGAALIASRHQSAFDTFVWLTLLPRCCYVLKQELVRIPLFGSLLTATGMIAVDRESGASAIRTLLREGDRACRELRQIVIFPEGTRSEPGKPGELQPGIAALAARTGLPVVPVSTNSGRYWGRRAFQKRPGTIKIVIASPISPRTERKALMAALEIGLAAVELNEPV